MRMFVCVCVSACVCLFVCLCVCVCLLVVRFLCFLFVYILYVNCFDRTMFYMCIEYIYVNMYHVSAQGVDERMINVHYYYYNRS